MEPVWTGNTIKDIVNNVKAGIIMVFWDGKKLLCYHFCERGYIIPTETVIYVDSRGCNSLNNNKLSFMLANYGLKICDCNIKKIATTKAKFGKVICTKFV